MKFICFCFIILRYMKKWMKYLIVVIVFLLVMSGILIYFTYRSEKIKLINKSNDLLEFLYTLDSGDYEYSKGFIFNNNKLISDTYYYDGNGKINIDKYGNVKFYINTDNYCIYKASIGKVSIKDGECKNYSNLSVGITKNNKAISFFSTKNNLSYKLSNKDDFKGKWISEEYNGNIVIKSYNEGDNYIWFKDENGVLSDVIKFNVDCLNGNKVTYNSDVFYCSGSTLLIDDDEWIVVKDIGSEITLMLAVSIEDKFSHCTNYKSEYCYYNEKESSGYSWNNSHVNYYLNNVYINKLNDKIKSSLISKQICDEYIYNDSNDNIGGNLKEEIEASNDICNKYTSSKVRILSYNEFNYIYNKLEDISLFEGNYWLINSFVSNKGSVINSNNEVYIMEDLTEVNSIRPVITISKNK